jgi:ferric hydroxamate transport system ATP-binding protein
MTVKSTSVQQAGTIPAVLLADTLSISYGETPIVSDLSLQLRTGQITAFVGPNGSGKSTILRTLARLLDPSGGAVYLDGADIARTPTRQIAQKLAILPQEPDAPAGITVWDLIGYGRYPYQGFLGTFSREDYDAMEWALEVTNLVHFRDRAVDSLSGGERQRAWIAMSLAQQTDVLLLDEPTTFLDIRYQIDTLSLVRELNETQRLTVGWVLHDLNQAAAYSDYMMMLQQGSVVYEGIPEEIMTTKSIRDVFGVDVSVIPDPVSGCPTCLLYGHCLRERF